MADADDAPDLHQEAEPGGGSRIRFSGDWTVLALRQRFQALGRRVKALAHPRRCCGI